MKSGEKSRQPTLTATLIMTRIEYTLVFEVETHTSWLLGIIIAVGRRKKAYQHIF